MVYAHFVPKQLLGIGRSAASTMFFDLRQSIGTPLYFADVRAANQRVCATAQDGGEDGQASIVFLISLVHRLAGHSVETDSLHKAGYLLLTTV